MKKRMLALILLLCMGYACAEEIFYTNNEDRYYHSNPDCDRPSGVNWDGQPLEVYPREAYDKVEISEDAAIAFAKEACPVCAKGLEPVYTGEHPLKIWNLPQAQWERGDIACSFSSVPEGSSEVQETAGGMTFQITNEYAIELSKNRLAFYDYYGHNVDFRLGADIPDKHAYPDCFAGHYGNNSGGYTYMLVDPTPEMVEAFVEKFGGAWIVPAKYGWNEMYAAYGKTYDALQDWCAVHPDADVQVGNAFACAWENMWAMKLSGRDWQQAAAALDEIAPVYIGFARDTDSPS